MRYSNCCVGCASSTHCPWQDGDDVEACPYYELETQGELELHLPPIPSPDTDDPKIVRRRETLIVSAFPGTGKSFIYDMHIVNPDFLVLDSDSSGFDKAHFPANYMRHIRENIGRVDVIFVSSHAAVRKALCVEELNFILAYPAMELKSEYLRRYTDRGSPPAFVDLLNKNWETWVQECRDFGPSLHSSTDGRYGYVLELTSGFLWDSWPLIIQSGKGRNTV